MHLPIQPVPRELSFQTGGRARLPGYSGPKGECCPDQGAPTATILEESCHCHGGKGALEIPIRTLLRRTRPWMTIRCRPGRPARRPQQAG